MNKIILMLIAFMTIFTATDSFAANKKEITTVELITDVDCDHCVNKIMNYLPFQRGVKRVKVDLPTQIVRVNYDTQRATNESIIELLKKIDVKASVRVTPPKEID